MRNKFILVLALFLAACSQAIEPTPSASPSPDLLATRYLPTDLPIPTIEPSATLTPTRVYPSAVPPSATASRTPIPTDTPTVTPTATWLPPYATSCDYVDCSQLNELFQTATQIEQSRQTAIAQPTLTPEATPTAETFACLMKGSINAPNGVNVRASNSLNSEIVDAFPVGLVVWYYAPKIEDAQGGWSWVRVIEFRYDLQRFEVTLGWVASEFIAQDGGCR